MTSHDHNLSLQNLFRQTNSSTHTRVLCLAGPQCTSTSTCFFCLVCEQLRVSGAMFQTGLEGDYSLLDETCPDNTYVMYRQATPATGWGDVFYLYYINVDKRPWGGWVFSKLTTCHWMTNQDACIDVKATLVFRNVNSDHNINRTIDLLISSDDSILIEERVDVMTSFKV